MKNRKNNKNRRRGGSSLNPGVYNPLRPLLNVRIQSCPFTLTQATSGTGCITAQESKVSITSGSAVALNPFGIGGRLYQFGSLFTQYRVNACNIIYFPFSSAAGVVDMVAGTSSTPTYGSRSFSLCVSPDPAFTNAGFLNQVTSGGILANTSKRSRLKVRGDALGSWLWTSTSASTPTTQDLRQSAFGYLQGAFVDNSSTATAIYGALVIDLDVDFRGDSPYDNPIGVQETVKNNSSAAAAPQSFLLPSSEPAPTGGWFFAKAEMKRQ